MRRRLGGEPIHPVALGAMNLSIEGRPPRAKALATLRAAVDAGASLIDTADVYARDGADAGHNLRLVGEARTGAWISTKVGVRREGGRWIHQGDPAYLRRAVDASLIALGVDTIDLLSLHAVDARVPIEESIGALARLQEEGKARWLGVSNVDRAQLDRALLAAPLVSVQNEASPFVPPDPAVLARCESEGLTFLGYAPMGGWRAGQLVHLPGLREAADRYGASPFELTIATLLTCSDAMVVLAGASRPDNAVSSVRAAELTLPAEDAARLRAALLKPR